MKILRKSDEWIIFSLTIFSSKAKQVKMEKIFFENYFMSKQMGPKGPKHISHTHKERERERELAINCKYNYHS